MQVTIDLLDLRTVDKAIDEIEQYQKRVNNLILGFLVKCAKTVRDMANKRIASLPYDGDIISGLQNGWSIETDEEAQVVTLNNSYEKAVYIEFGTGLVGSDKSHKEAAKAGYQYDVKGHGAEGWRFLHLVDEPLDLPKSYYSEKRIDHTGMWYNVHTTGAPATMFLYETAMEFIDYKICKRLWKDTIKGL